MERLYAVEGVVMKAATKTIFRPETEKTEAYYATRVTPLGLTAYGGTKEGSLARLEQMLGAFVRALSREGRLETRFNASGVEWHYEGVCSNG